jgi:hypothetical protein
MKQISISLDSVALQLISQMMDEKIAAVNQTVQNAIFSLQLAKIIKKREVAELLNISPARVTQLVDSGIIPTAADGHITEFHLRKYLNNNGKVQMDE